MRRQEAGDLGCLVTEHRLLHEAEQLLAPELRAAGIDHGGGRGVVGGVATACGCVMPPLPEVGANLA